ncbi:DedA family protein [Ahrensia kielensis]|uniref:VTT domain-containing protein n=1 Tax=Ahrensia kielensis TaxID=76980 RepID=A0ABU9T4Y7_9HYPH|nr:VTT domain-containing protein [Ahrensia kielensis]
MIDTVLTWFALYGVQTLFVALFAGQTGIIPVPTTIILLTVGTMLVDKTVAPINVFLSCLSGAILGDQFGYAIGRAGGPAFAAYLADSRWGKMFKRAEMYSLKWGAIGVFFSRWLVSPVGPYLNYLVGMTGLPWLRFTIMSACGEAVWIAGFLAIGYGFSASITSIDSLVANVSFFIGGLVATLFFWSRVKRSLAKSKAGKRL